MKPDDIVRYADRIYGYAVKRTFSRDEADELSQEILCAAIRSLPRLKDESRFEPWLWGIAANVSKAFRRGAGKRRAIYSYDALPELPYEPEDDNEQLYAAVRAKIASLSAIYRDVVILYYYDGLSIRQISEKLCVPAGTIAYRLSESRKKLKRRCAHMTESALKPIRLHLAIYGSGDYDGDRFPFPQTYIRDALSQNILFHCYETPKTVEQLSELCGVPAYYVEDSLRNLSARGAVTTPSKGRYQTDFIIWSDVHGRYCEENAEKALRPLLDDMVTALRAVAAEGAQIDFYRAERSEDDLFFLYGVLAFEYAQQRFCTLPYPPIEPAYDSFRWRYVGSVETGAHPRITIHWQRSANLASRGSYMHTVYSHFAGIPGRDMMYDSHINVCEDLLRTGRTDDVDAAARAIQNGFVVRRTDGTMSVACPAFTKRQKEALDAAAEKHLAPLMPRYTALTRDFIAGYKKLFPRHLSDDADRMCRSLFRDLYQVVAEYAVRSGKAAAPTPGTFCDVLLQYK